MEATGWSFDWNSNSVFRPANGLCSPFPSAYCGWKSGNAVGAIRLTLSGSGTAVVVFGNPHTGGTVKLSLDTTEIASVGANTNSRVATFAFTDGQVVKIEEFNAIIVFYSISFACADSGAAPVTLAPTNAPSDAPSNAPTNAQTNAPSDAPSNTPSNAPTNAPINTPTNAPS